MSNLWWRGVAAVVSGVASAGAGLATNVFTSSWAWRWGVALAVFVVLGVVSQVWLTVAGNGRASGVLASGAGAVAVGGSSRGPITTVVSGVAGGSDASMPAAEGVEASGPGSVAVGGDAQGAISTRVQGVDGGAVD